MLGLKDPEVAAPGSLLTSIRSLGRNVGGPGLGSGPGTLEIFDPSLGGLKLIMHVCNLIGANRQSGMKIIPFPVSGSDVLPELAVERITTRYASLEPSDLRSGRGQTIEQRAHPLTGRGRRTYLTYTRS